MLLLGNWRQNISHPKAEFVTLNFSGPLIIFHNITYPIIKLLNGSARGLTGLFGLKMMSESEVAHTEEEARMILSDSLKVEKLITQNMNMLTVFSSSLIVLQKKLWFLELKLSA